MVAGLVVVGVVLFLSGGGVRSDLSARDQELCAVVLDEEEPIGYLSTEIDRLISNGGNFSSEGDAFAFQEVPVRRSMNELSARIANYDQPDSAGYIDDPELLDRAKKLLDVLFDLQLGSDLGGPMDSGLLNSARAAIDGMAETCTS